MPVRADLRRKREHLNTVKHACKVFNFLINSAWHLAFTVPPYQALDLQNLHQFVTPKRSELQHKSDIPCLVCFECMAPTVLPCKAPAPRNSSISIRQSSNTSWNNKVLHLLEIQIVSAMWFHSEIDLCSVWALLDLVHAAKKAFHETNT